MSGLGLSSGNLLGLICGICTSLKQRTDNPMIKTREELFSRMVHQCRIWFTHSGFRGGRWGLIQSIQMEDGSGYSFNVTISDTGHDLWTIHFKTAKPTTVGPGNLTGD